MTIYDYYIHLCVWNVVNDTGRRRKTFTDFLKENPTENSRTRSTSKRRIREEKKRRSGSVSKPNIRLFLKAKRPESRAGHVWLAVESLTRNVLIENPPQKKWPRGRPRQRRLNREEKDILDFDNSRWRDGPDWTDKLGGSEQKALTACIA